MPKTDKLYNEPEAAELSAAAAASADEAQKKASQVTIPRDEVLRRVTIANRIQSYSNPVQALRNAKINADFRDATETYPYHFYLPFLQKNVYIQPGCNEEEKFLNNPFARKRKYLWLQVDSHEEMTSAWFWSAVRTNRVGAKEYIAHRDFSHPDLTGEAEGGWLTDNELDVSSVEPVIKLLQEYNQKSPDTDGTTDTRKISFKSLEEGLLQHADEVKKLLIVALFTESHTLFGSVAMLYHYSEALKDVIFNAMSIIYARLDGAMPKNFTEAVYISRQTEFLSRIVRNSYYCYGTLLSAFATNNLPLITMFDNEGHLSSNIRVECADHGGILQRRGDDCVFTWACASHMLTHIKSLREEYATHENGGRVLHNALPDAFAMAVKHDQVDVMEYLFSLRVELEASQQESIDLDPVALFLSAIRRGAFKSLRVVLDMWKSTLKDAFKKHEFDECLIKPLSEYGLSLRKNAITNADAKLLLEAITHVSHKKITVGELVWDMLGRLDRSLRRDHYFHTKTDLEEEQTTALTSATSLLELLHLQRTNPAFTRLSYSEPCDFLHFEFVPWETKPGLRVRMQTFYAYFPLLKRWLEDYQALQIKNKKPVNQHLYFLLACLQEVSVGRETSREMRAKVYAPLHAIIVAYESNPSIQIPEDTYYLCLSILCGMTIVNYVTPESQLSVTDGETADETGEINVASARLELHAYWHHLRSDERKQKTAAHRDVSAANKRAGVELAMEILMQPSRDNITNKQKLSDAVKKLEEWKIHYRSTTNKAGFECTTTGAGVLNRIRKLAAR